MSDIAAKWLNPLDRATSAHLAALLDFDSVPELAEPAPAGPQVIMVPAFTPPPVPPPAELLHQAVRGRVGLVQVSIPERPYPLWLRAGTDDEAAALSSLAPLPLLPYAPRKILEIGAGAGFRTASLAAAFPEADILAVESNPAYQRVNLLNTLPYNNVASLTVTVSTDNARYAYTGRAGEAGQVVLAREEQGNIGAVPLLALIANRQFTHYDTVVITPDAASDHLLRAPWPVSVRFILVETGGEKLHPATAACYPEQKFASRIIGKYMVIGRREPEREVAPRRPAPLFTPDGLPSSLMLENVPAQPHSYFAIGGNAFRLHANRPGEPPARLVLKRDCSGYTQLQVTLRVGHADALPVKFRIAVLPEAGGAPVLEAEEILEGGAARGLSFPLHAPEGVCRIVFETAMAELGAPNHSAWAEIFAPTLV